MMDRWKARISISIFFACLLAIFLFFCWIMYFSSWLWIFLVSFHFCCQHPHGEKLSHLKKRETRKEKNVKTLDLIYAWMPCLLISWTSIRYSITAFSVMTSVMNPKSEAESNFESRKCWALPIFQSKIKYLS